MGRDGWELLPSTPEIYAIIRDCAEAKDRFLAEAIECADELLGSADLHTPPHRRPEQLAKAAVRGLFRFDPRGRRLAVAAARRLVKEYGLDDATYYAAPPYTYIHLPEDIQAASEMHRDDYEREQSSFFISWTPLNDCTHAPIAIVPETHSYNPVQRLRWSLRQRGLTINSSSPRVVTPSPLLGESLAWSARTYHAGTHNRLSTTHVALNTKIRNRPIPLEPSLDLSSGTEPPAHPNRATADHTRSFLLLIKTLDLEVQPVGTALRPTTLLSAITEILDDLGHDPVDRARLSFSLSMAGMRIADDPSTAALWHLAATLLAPEYLWSLQQVLSEVAASYPEDLNRLVEEILGRHPYHQVAMAISLSNQVSFPTPTPRDLPVHSWI